MSMVNYTEYVTLCRYENVYDMYLNHTDEWFVELKGLSHSCRTGQE